MTETTAFWVEAPHVGALRATTLPPIGPDDVLVRTRWTGISRGTESTVFAGRVPDSERDRMRAPFQEGTFPGPVKYGYCNVGIVERGPAELLGRTVFSLFPHQAVFTVPADAVAVVPDGVPARRAVLAAAVETAVNVLWDAAPLIGDGVTIVGAGLIGTAVALLAARLPGADVELVDTDAGRLALARRVGARGVHPDTARAERDVVVHASGSPDGLVTAMRLAVTEGVVVEASWYGDRVVPLPLGADFHARRLTIRSSQVGTVSPRRAATRTHRDRMALALDLLRDDAFDALLGGTSSWRDLPELMRALTDDATAAGEGPCRTVDWEDAPWPSA